jgi:hypothetical protein
VTLHGFDKSRGRPVLTGCVGLQTSMQAREAGALNKGFETISGENTYAMAA